MKLARYRYENREYFGFVYENSLVSFLSMDESDECVRLLSSIKNYLEHLPASRSLAESLKEKYVAEEFAIATPIDDVQLLPIMVNPPALLDFGLTPRHMFQSAKSLITREMSGFKRFIALKLMKKRVERVMSSKNYAYYKGNNNAISGEGDTVVWPSYTSYLDMEPELAFIYGNESEKIAGYCILNDLSARDVQVPELNDLSLTRSKDFDNGLSSFLVTPDEVGDPRDLSVKVSIADREEWFGDTSDYLISPDEVLAYLETIFVPATGTVIGMGTIPDCCGLERDVWVRPGEKVTIEFEKLGTLNQFIPVDVSISDKGRWEKRQDLADS